MDRAHKNARTQERRSAKDYGARLQPRSGSGETAKQDLRSSTELIECKTTTRHSFSLKALDLLDAARNAMLDYRRMVFEIEFTNPLYRTGTLSPQFVVLEKDEYLAMAETVAMYHDLRNS